MENKIGIILTILMVGIILYIIPIVISSIKGLIDDVNIRYTNKVSPLVKNNYMKAKKLVFVFLMGVIVLSAISLFATTTWGSTILPNGLVIVETASDIDLGKTLAQQKVLTISIYMIVGLIIAFVIEYVGFTGWNARADAIKSGRSASTVLLYTLLALFFSSWNIFSAGSAIQMGYVATHQDASYKKQYIENIDSIDEVRNSKKKEVEAIKSLKTKKESLIANIDTDNNLYQNDDIKRLKSRIYKLQDKLETAQKQYFKRTKAVWRLHPHKYKTALSAVASVTITPVKEALKNAKAELKNALSQAGSYKLSVIENKTKGIDALIKKHQAEINRLINRLEKLTKRSHILKKRWDNHISKLYDEFPIWYGLIAGLILFIGQVIAHRSLDEARTNLNMRKTNILRAMGKIYKDPESPILEPNQTKPDQVEPRAKNTVQNTNRSSFEFGSDQADQMGEPSLNQTKPEPNQANLFEEIDQILNQIDKPNSDQIDQEPKPNFREDPMGFYKQTFVDFFKENEKIPTIKDCMDIWGIKNKETINKIRGDLRDVYNLFISENTKTIPTPELIKLAKGVENV